MQSQGIKSEEKRRATGKNGKQMHGNILPTWSLLHDPEETQPIAWPCAVSMDRLYRKHAQQQSIKARTKEEIYLQAPSHLVSPTGQNLPHWWLTPPTSRFSHLIPLAKRNKPHTLQTWYCSIGNLVMLETVFSRIPFLICLKVCICLGG